MPLKVGVELQIHAVTCPGVFLPEKHDIYLSVCILGQYKETECLPPVFPLLFHEKMLFEKVFESAVDPAAVTEMLERDDLAFYEENTRDFLFPEPKLTPAYPGVDRELLMKTSSHFPGIAPKIEFSTRTTITELPLQRREKNYAQNRTRNQRSGSASPKRRSRSLTQCKTSVKRVDSSKSFSEVTSPLPYCNVKKSVRSARDSPKFHVKRTLTFDNCETSNTSVKIVREPAEQAASEHDSSSLETDELFSYPQCSPSWRHLAFHHAASPATSQRLKSPSPVRSPSPLQYRLHSGVDFSWEKINERVRSLLTSAQAKQRLSSGATKNEIDDVLERRSVSLRNSRPNDSGE
ncbi:spermatogenesis associated 6-like protein isoform X4 [Apteryx mantelli]|uniref:Spermatogenesis associated 6-like protein isoform X4 n=1 Tax=Apteryx mantelli TaxID=2696672 RepID=A0ABM4G3I5_9AVES